MSEADATPRAAARALPRWALAALAATVLWAAGLIWFAEDIPREVADTTTRTDAVVVLTGGAGRLSTGIRLLDEQKARKLFVSGVYRGVDVAQILRVVRHRGSNLDCCMVLGHTADDTQGNAEETARWMAEEHYTSLRLVTSSYHMRRSLLEFRVGDGAPCPSCASSPTRCSTGSSRPKAGGTGPARSSSSSPNTASTWWR